jgi:hypothetical protein
MVLVAVMSALVVLLALIDVARAAENTASARWKNESVSGKEFLVAAAVSGIQTGWSLGTAQAQGDIGGYLVDQYRHGAVPVRIPGAVGTMRLTNPPRYSHSPLFYVKLIDRAYERPENRTTDLPGLLVCFADRPLGKCPPSLTIGRGGTRQYRREASTTR